MRPCRRVLGEYLQFLWMPHSCKLRPMIPWSAPCTVHPPAPPFSAKSPSLPAPLFRRNRRTASDPQNRRRCGGRYSNLLSGKLPLSSPTPAAPSRFRLDCPEIHGSGFCHRKVRDCPHGFQKQDGLRPLKSRSFQPFFPAEAPLPVPHTPECRRIPRNERRR